MPRMWKNQGDSHIERHEFHERIRFRSLRLRLNIGLLMSGLE